MTVVSYPRLKIELKGRHGRSAGNGAYERKETTLRVMLAIRPKAIFFIIGIISPGNYVWLFVLIIHRATCTLETSLESVRIVQS
jgi:hypothetical protein